MKEVNTVNRPPLLAIALILSCFILVTDNKATATVSTGIFSNSPDLKTLAVKIVSKSYEDEEADDRDGESRTILSRGTESVDQGSYSDSQNGYDYSWMLNSGLTEQEKIIYGTVALAGLVGMIFGCICCCKICCGQDSELPRTNHLIYDRLSPEGSRMFNENVAIPALSSPTRNTPCISAPTPRVATIWPPNQPFLSPASF